MSLIAHYPLNDNAASSAVSDAYGSNNGVYYAGAGVQNTSTGTSVGIINRALEFDGVNEYVSIADNIVFTPALTPFSISAWVNMDDATTFSIANKGVYNTDAEWGFRCDSFDKIHALVYDESVANCFIGRNSSVALTGYEGIWIHLVMTYTGGTASSSAKIYLNGVQVDDTNVELNQASFVAVENLAGNVIIGGYIADYSDGQIDNVMFFNHELSLEEVERLYNNGSGTENGGDIDEKISPRRLETAKMPTRIRY